MKRVPVLVLCAVLAATPAAAQDLIPVPDGELDEARGGFLTAEGLVFDLEAVVRSFDEAGLALETRVDWAPDGALAQQSGTGVSGGASFLHQVADGDLRNLIVNSDSDRSLRVETDVTLTLPGFTGIQGDFTRSLVSLRIGDDLAHAASSFGR